MLFRPQRRVQLSSFARQHRCHITHLRDLSLPILVRVLHHDILFLHGRDPLGTQSRFTSRLTACAASTGALQLCAGTPVSGVSALECSAGRTPSQDVEQPLQFSSAWCVFSLLCCAFSSFCCWTSAVPDERCLLFRTLNGHDICFSYSLHNYAQELSIAVCTGADNREDRE